MNIISALNMPKGMTTSSACFVLIRNRFPQILRFRPFRSEYPETKADLFDISDFILVMKNFITVVNKF